MLKQFVSVMRTGRILVRNATILIILVIVEENAIAQTTQDSKNVRQLTISKLLDSIEDMGNPEYNEYGMQCYYELMRRLKGKHLDDDEVGIFVTECLTPNRNYTPGNIDWAIAYNGLLLEYYENYNSIHPAEKLALKVPAKVGVDNGEFFGSGLLSLPDSNNQFLVLRTRVVWRTKLAPLVRVYLEGVGLLSEGIVDQELYVQLPRLNAGSHDIPLRVEFGYYELESGEYVDVQSIDVTVEIGVSSEVTLNHVQSVGISNVIGKSLRIYLYNEETLENGMHLCSLHISISRRALKQHMGDDVWVALRIDLVSDSGERVLTSYVGVDKYRSSTVWSRERATIEPSILKNLTIRVISSEAMAYAMHMSDLAQLTYDNLTRKELIMIETKGLRDLEKQKIVQLYEIDEQKIVFSKDGFN